MLYKSKKRVYVFEAHRDYGGGLFFQSALTPKGALRLAELATRNRFKLTLLGTLKKFEGKVLKEQRLDYTWEE